MPGKALWLEEKETVETDDPAILYGDDDYSPSDLVTGQKFLKASAGMEFHVGTDNSPHFYGVVFTTGNSNGGDDTGFSKIPDIDKIKGKLRDQLEPLGLWKEEDFGLYVNLHCSY